MERRLGLDDSIERRHLQDTDGARRAEVVSHGNLIFTSGIQPASTDGDIKEQMRSALERLDAMLHREGRTALSRACFAFLPHRVSLDLLGWEEADVFAHS